MKSARGDYLMTSGISNGGGYALLAGVSLAKGRIDQKQAEELQTILSKQLAGGRI